MPTKGNSQIAQTKNKLLILIILVKGINSNNIICFFHTFKGIMLVYDITNEKSFDNIKNWIRNIEEVQ